FTQLAALDPRALEATGSIPLTVPVDPMAAAPVYDFPVVDRRLKGDRLNVTPPAPLEPTEPRPRSQSKDMADRLPGMAAPEGVVSQPPLSKGDRLAAPPVQTGDATPAAVYRRAGLAPGADTLAKRVLGVGPRQPVEVAAPAEPVADTVLRRAGLAP